MLHRCAELGKFGVIMADPPWDIHMNLPYGTMKDDEMREMKVLLAVEHARPTRPGWQRETNASTKSKCAAAGREGAKGVPYGMLPCVRDGLPIRRHRPKACHGHEGTLSTHTRYSEYSHAYGTGCPSGAIGKGKRCGRRFLSNVLRVCAFCFIASDRRAVRRRAVFYVGDGPCDGAWP